MIIVRSYYYYGQDKTSSVKSTDKKRDENRSIWAWKKNISNITANSCAKIFMIILYTNIHKKNLQSFIQLGLIENCWSFTVISNYNCLVFIFSIVSNNTIYIYFCKEEGRLSIYVYTFRYWMEGGRYMMIWSCRPWIIKQKFKTPSDFYSTF